MFIYPANSILVPKTNHHFDLFGMNGRAALFAIAHDHPLTAILGH
jgi:hypothetical protein